MTYSMSTNPWSCDGIVRLHNAYWLPNVPALFKLKLRLLWCILEPCFKKRLAADANTILTSTRTGTDHVCFCSLIYFFYRTILSFIPLQRIFSHSFRFSSSIATQSIYKYIHHCHSSRIRHTWSVIVNSCERSATIASPLEIQTSQVEVWIASTKTMRI